MLLNPERRVVGVVLSGSGADGLRGCLATKAAGGLTLVQSPVEARHRLMPIHAIQGDDVDAVLAVRDLATVLTALAVGERVDPAALESRAG